MAEKNPSEIRIAAASKQLAALKAEDIMKSTTQDTAKRTPLSNPDCAHLANSTGMQVSVVRKLFPKLTAAAKPPAAK